MANSTQRAVSDGTLAVLDLQIDYLTRAEITVYFDEVPVTTGWEWVGVTSKQLVFDPVVPLGVEVLVKRSTDISKLRHYFSRGAAFTAATLDEDLTQVLHIAQEASEANLSGEFFTDINMHGHRIMALADPETDADAVTLGFYRDDASSPARLQIGTVSASAPGAAAEASITGSTGQQSLNLVLPRGEKGDKGDKGDSVAASKSDNLAGGTAGAIPYQTAADTTTFLPAGTTGHYLTQGPDVAPAWAALPPLLSNEVNTWLKDSQAYSRLYFQQIDGDAETTYTRGYGTVPHRFRDGDDTDIMVLYADGRATLETDAVNPQHIPRFGQLPSRPGHTYTGSDWCWLDRTGTLKLHWGRTSAISGATTVNLTAFTTLCLTGWATPFRTASETDGNYSAYFHTDGNKDTATVVQDGAGSGAGGSGQVSWFAIGI